MSRARCRGSYLPLGSWSQPNGPHGAVMLAVPAEGLCVQAAGARPVLSYLLVQ